MNMRPKFVALAVVGALAGAFGTSTAKADLIFQGVVTIGGTGLGAVDTILTMQSHGSGTVESGQVSWGNCTPGPCTNVVTPDPNPPGFTPAGSTDMTGLNHTIAVSDTGWTGTQSLGIVFNPQEPGVGSGNNNITLNNLVMTIYNDTTGATVFTAPWLDGPLSLAGLTGTGNSGYLFALNAIETDELLSSGATGADRIGLLAYATNAQGGPETFFGTVVALPVPEPNSSAILGTTLLALAGISYVVRRRRENDL